MKNWILYLLVLLFIVLGAWLMPILVNDPGSVKIVIFDWVLETNVVVLTVLFTGLFIGLWLTARILEAPKRLANRLARRGLEQGLLALAEGDWKRAEKTLLRSARHLNSPAGYLAAARSVHGSDAEQRREAYLAAADDGGRKTRLLIGLTRARVLMAEERWLDAAQMLNELRARHGKRHDQILRMLLHCYREMADWRGALTILPDLRKRKIIDDQQIADMTALALRQTAEQGHGNLQALWQSVPKLVQQYPTVLAAYASAAAHVRHPEWASPLLMKALKRDWRAELVQAFTQVAGHDAKKSLAQCESWRKQHPEDADLEQLMGQLCRQQALWGKAREHFERSIALRPSAEAYRQLGDFLTERGENDAALICYRNALKVGQGGVPQTLPAPEKSPQVLLPHSLAHDGIDTPKDYA